MSNVHDAFADFPASETLLVTVENSDESYQAGLNEIRALDRDESVEQPDTISFQSTESLFETFTPRTMQLLETIAKHEPESIRETARLVDRDVKNVHTELSELARLGILRFEEQGRSKRPVFPYQRLQIDVGFAIESGGDEADSEPVTSLAAPSSIQTAQNSLSDLNIQNLLDSELLQAISGSAILDLQRTLTQPGIDSELMQQLQSSVDSIQQFQSLADSEILQALQQPAMDPEIVEAIQQSPIDEATLQALSVPVRDLGIIELLQQPPINETTLQALSEPAIDSELIRVLESLDDTTPLQAYKTAAAIEQVDDQPLDEVGEKKIEEDQEPPEKGGFLSTFINTASIYLLQHSDNLPEDSVSHLIRSALSKDVQVKIDSFREFVDSARDSAADLITLAAVFAFHATWGLYFPNETESLEEESTEEDNEDG